MRLSQALGLTAVAALILAAAGLVLSLQVTNPLLAGADSATAAFVALATTAVAVVATVVLGLPDDRTRTPYW